MLDPYKSEKRPPVDSKMSGRLVRTHFVLGDGGRDKYQPHTHCRFGIEGRLRTPIRFPAGRVRNDRG